MESVKRIEARAGEWLLRRDSGRWSEQDQGQLTDWLSEDTAHRVAFLRLEAVWDEMNRLKAVGAGFPPLTVPTREQLGGTSGTAEPTRASKEKVSPPSRRRTFRYSIAAAALVCVALVYTFAVGPFADDRYATPIGGVATIPLQDGSSVTLSTASEVRVQLTQSERQIDLRQGEAFFEVASDPSRPFIVRAGDKRVIAVGTKFSVRHDGEDVRLVVTEGVVRFEDANSRTTVERSATPEAPVLQHLAAGSVVRATRDSAIVRTTSLPEAEQLLSWRAGYLVFQDTALPEALAEFNRFSDRKIVIGDPQLATLRLSGRFRSNNAASFIRLLEMSYGIQAQAEAQQISLATRR
jgi:transmembrane sensor